MEWRRFVTYLWNDPRSLESRRIRSDLIETYKIMIGIYDIPREIFFDCDNSGLSGHEHKLLTKRFRLDIRKCSFSNRVIDAWNSLPALCVNSAAINCFKTHVSVALEPAVTWCLLGDDTESSHGADLDQLCTRCDRCLSEGVSAFESVGDVVNMAVLQSNHGKLMRLRAQSVASALFDAKKREFTNAERSFFLQVRSMLTQLNMITATTSTAKAK